MADLYLAEPLEGTQKDWIFKLYRWDDTVGNVLLPRFQSAAQLLRSLRHPALPAVKEYFSLPDGFVLVIEYIQGRDLESIGSEQLLPFPPETVIHWGAELCKVFRYLHGRIPPVILRDLRPSNLIRESRNRLRLIDLELACTERDLCDYLPPGVPGFTAPEVLAGERPAPKTDLYSLGATLFYLLTLKVPSHENIDMLDRTISQTHSNLKRTLRRALHPDPGERYNNIDEFEESLAGD